MPHRAQQIQSAAAALISASPTIAASVFEQRVLTLGEKAQELPAVCVNLSEDTPLDENGATNLAFLDSLLALTIAIYAVASSEEDLRDELMRLRREVHVALMTDRALGLSFVIDTRYGGAAEPEPNTEGGRLSARLETRWLVHYRMNILDPN